VGDETASIGIKISRGNLEREEAEELLCGRRLDVSLIAFAPGEEPGQKRLEGMERPELKTQCDVRSYATNPKSFRATLKFSLDQVDAGALAAFAKRPGVVNVLNVGESIPDEDSEPSDE